MYLLQRTSEWFSWIFGMGSSTAHWEKSVEFELKKSSEFYNEFANEIVNYCHQNNYKFDNPYDFFVKICFGTLKEKFHDREISIETIKKVTNLDTPSINHELHYQNESPKLMTMPQVFRCLGVTPMEFFEQI